MDGSELNGYHVKIFEDGSKYEGEWENGKKHGNGVFYWSNGNKYEG
jgi:hypothetical protein